MYISICIYKHWTISSMKWNGRRNNIMGQSRKPAMNNCHSQLNRHNHHTATKNIIYCQCTYNVSLLREPAVRDQSWKYLSSHHLMPLGDRVRLRDLRDVLICETSEPKMIQFQRGCSAKIWLVDKLSVKNVVSVGHHSKLGGQLNVFEATRSGLAPRPCKRGMIWNFFDPHTGWSAPFNSAHIMANLGGATNEETKLSAIKKSFCLPQNTKYVSTNSYASLSIRGYRYRLL